VDGKITRKKSEITEALANMYDFAYSVTGGGRINEEKEFLLRIRRFIESSPKGTVLLAESEWRNWDKE
jgi:hypothetical protein